MFDEKILDKNFHAHMQQVDIVKDKKSYVKANFLHLL